MRRILHLIGVLSAVGAAMPAWAGENAILRSGLRLHAERHEVEGGKVRLFSDGGMTELPEAAITCFEADEAVTALLPPQQPAEVAMSVAPIPAGDSPVELAALAARKYALPESFVRSVMRAESGFHPAALSPKGAIGLMQLMPDTARTLGVDPKVPKQNAEGGAQYLRDLLAKYEDNPDQVLLALAAYNAGPGAVEKYHGVPPYRETREYILRVLKNWDQRGADADGPAATAKKPKPL
jgi:soluble lytic murein transglycosylase-like protein